MEVIKNKEIKYKTVEDEKIKDELRKKELAKELIGEEERKFEKILNGIRSAVIPIIMSAAMKLKAKSLVSKLSYIMMIISSILCTFTNINKILVVLMGIIVGILHWKVRKKNVIS